MKNDDDVRHYTDNEDFFEDLMENLTVYERFQLSELTERCGEYTKQLLCTIMESGQTLPQAIQTLMTMIEIMQDKKQRKRLYEEQLLRNAMRAIRKKKLWRELERIAINTPQTGAGFILGM